MRYSIISIFLFLLLLSSIPVLPEGSSIASGISFDHQVEDILIRTTYWSPYGSEKWRITDNKILYIKLEILDMPEGATILVEHMHADCFIHSYFEDIDGLLQDTMDDKIHGGSTPGFLVSTSYPYTEIFSIEGYSKWLIEGWMFVVGGYGSGRIREKRLTEENLIEAGVLGSEFVIVYDILIKYQGEQYYHKAMIIDNFYVFLDGGFVPPEGEEEKEVIAVYPYRVEGFIVGITGIAVLIIGIILAYISSRVPDFDYEGIAIALILGGLGLLLIAAALYWAYDLLVIES